MTSSWPGQPHLLTNLDGLCCGDQSGDEELWRAVSVGTKVEITS